MHTLPSNFPMLYHCEQKLLLESESWGRVWKSPPLPYHCNNGSNCPKKPLEVNRSKTSSDGCRCTLLC